MSKNKKQIKKSSKECQLTGFTKLDFEKTDKENAETKTDLNMNVKDSDTEKSADISVDGTDVSDRGNLSKVPCGKPKENDELDDMSNRNSGVIEQDNRKTVGSTENQSSGNEKNVNKEVQSNKNPAKLPEDHICVDTNSAKINTEDGNGNRGAKVVYNMQEGETDNLKEISSTSNTSLDSQEHCSVTITKNPSGENEARYWTGNKTIDKLGNNEIASESSHDSDVTADCITPTNDMKGAGGGVERNVPATEPAKSPSNEDKRGTEQQLAPENSDNDQKTPLVITAEEPSDDKKKSEMSTTTKNGQAELENQLNDNLLFYRNEICSRPFPGVKIEEMLKWKGDYLMLERTHSYIQWLFPIPESRGMNYYAQALQEHEAKAISEDKTLRARVLEAYKMMLHFYGMELADDHTGEVKRGDNWQERYQHLDRSVHNRFRITRILKALGELGFEHLQEPWLEFIVQEATIRQALPSFNGSSMVHFIGAVKDEAKQGKLYHLLSDLNAQIQGYQQGSNETKTRATQKDDKTNSDDKTDKDLVKESGSGNKKEAEKKKGKDDTSDESKSELDDSSTVVRDTTEPDKQDRNENAITSENATEVIEDQNVGGNIVTKSTDKEQGPSDTERLTFDTGDKTKNNDCPTGKKGSAVEREVEIEVKDESKSYGSNFKGKNKDNNDTTKSNMILCNKNNPESNRGTDHPAITQEEHNQEPVWVANKNVEGETETDAPRDNTVNENVENKNFRETTQYSTTV